MDPARERAALEVVDEALERPPAERRTFVEGACGGDAELRACVEELLALEADGSELPTLSIPRGVWLDPAAPATSIPGYTLCGVLGEGGMGRVFEAEQAVPRRRVALKTLRLGLDSARARRRFQFEAELLARLEHPAIAKVYDVGTYREAHLLGELEVPYFAMEYVEGARDLLSYARGEELSRDARLRLFLEFCEAVQYGHDRGVLHRDLKASNLLVGSDGRPKVIDFGVARPTAEDPGSDRPRTSTGEVFGTPSTVAPELLEGLGTVADVRADVYALGIVLYELICGAPPFPLAGLPLHRAVEVVLAGDPGRPGAREPEFPADLEAVLLTAIHRDPARRYGSVAALEGDLRRFLDHEPVTARRPSALEKARLFVRRHRLAVAAGTTVALALLAGGGASLSFGLRAAAAGRDQARAAQDARDAQAATAQALAEAHAVRDELIALSATFVFDFGQRLSRLEGATELRAEILGRGLELLGELEDRAAAEPSQCFALAFATLRLGDLLGNPEDANLGRPDQAREAYAQAARLVERGEQLAEQRVDRVAEQRAEQFGRQQDGTGEHAAGLRALIGRREAQLLLHDGETVRAEERYAAVLADLRGRIDVGVGDPSLWVEVGHLLAGYGQTRGLAGDHAAAAQAFTELLDLRRQLAAQDPQSISKALDLGTASMLLAAAVLRSGDPQGAIDLYQHATEQFDTLRERHPDDVSAGLARLQVRLPYSVALREAGRHAESESLVRQGLDFAAEQLERDPSLVNLHRFRGDLWYGLGQSLVGLATAADAPPDLRSSRLTEARAAFEQAHATFSTLRDNGQLLPREADFLPRIQDRIAEVDRLATSRP
jgi:tRNA A-37 threonylcarbamoyl transferase component Bud32/tetratricopeptide (TPR) repeat protein